MVTDIPEIARTMARQFGYTVANVTFRKKKLVASVRVRDGIASFSLQHEVKMFPIEAISALFFTLLARCRQTIRTPEYREQRSVWLAFIRQRTEEDRQRRIKQDRSHCNPVGETYNLFDRFTRVEEDFEDLFHGFFTQSNVFLTWGKRTTYRRFGQWHSQSNIIEISKTLDSPRVPEYVVDFVIYHEMLHGLAGKLKKGQKYHTKQFRELESKFPRAKEANEFLANIYKRKGDW
ncbi:MAG TPA: SprT-like domain-containing protein [Candidatus Lokiarchaeia archaeon]|nr:SprT-like domain-containing protein [Candidatus Lokiarchaeia archaeon]